MWHGASNTSAGHRNSAAQWGVRSKEFGASGYNQLLFDDTDAQGRVQLKASHAGTELTLGHLVHHADNFRGSLRGVGAELRTDAYGAVRGGAGLLVSSYRLAHAAEARDPAGDNGAGIAMLKHAVLLGETFSKMAREHKTVEFAAHQGPDKKDQSVLDDEAAPLKAILKAVSGMVSNASLNASKEEAAAKQTKPDADKVPHATDPVIAVAAHGGVGVNVSNHVSLRKSCGVSNKRTRGLLETDQIIFKCKN